MLLDEIEKAHPDVWNMLLQIMEEGRLTDNVGRTIDFKNTILIMTTNIGAEQIQGKKDFNIFGKRDETTNYEKMKETLKMEMERNFRPEFLNRVDDIIVFRSLTKEDLKRIIDIELAKVSARLKEKGLILILTDEAKEVIIEKGTSLEFGARPLRRAIEHHLEDPLSEDLLVGVRRQGHPDRDRGRRRTRQETGLRCDNHNGDPAGIGRRRAGSSLEAKPTGITKGEKWSIGDGPCNSQPPGALPAREGENEDSPLPSQGGAGVGCSVLPHFLNPPLLPSPRHSGTLTVLKPTSHPQLSQARSGCRFAHFNDTEPSPGGLHCKPREEMP